MLGGREAVRSVSPTGSFAGGTHDALSDLDVTAVGLDPRDEAAILDLLDRSDVLGRERYVGPDRALYRVLLRDGRQFDIKVLRREVDAQADAAKVPVEGTDEFWFALHAAHHAIARGREIVALDLVLASYRAVTQAYWSASEGVQSQIRRELQGLELRLGRAPLEKAIAHVARLAGHAFDDVERSRTFLSIIAQRSTRSDDPAL